MSIVALADAIEGPPDWTEEALCAQVDPDSWYPEKGGSTAPAKRICRRCPVIEECLAHALANGERFGIWGGKSERERRRMHERKRPTPRRSCGSAMGVRTHQKQREHLCYACSQVDQ